MTLGVLALKRSPTTQVGLSMEASQCLYFLTKSLVAMSLKRVAYYLMEVTNGTALDMAQEAT